MHMEKIGLSEPYKGHVCLCAHVYMWALLGSTRTALREMYLILRLSVLCFFFFSLLFRRYSALR